MIVRVRAATYRPRPREAGTMCGWVAQSPAPLVVTSRSGDGVGAADLAKGSPSQGGISDSAVVHADRGPAQRSCASGYGRALDQSDGAVVSIGPSTVTPPLCDARPAARRRRPDAAGSVHASTALISGSATTECRRVASAGPMTRGVFETPCVRTRRTSRWWMSHFAEVGDNSLCVPTIGECLNSVQLIGRLTWTRPAGPSRLRDPSAPVLPVGCRPSSPAG